MRLLVPAVLSVMLLPCGDLLAAAQEPLPAPIRATLLDAAASTDQALLAAVEAAIREHPGLAEVIRARALALKPELEDEIQTASAAPPSRTQTAVSGDTGSGGGGLVIAGLGGLAAVGAVVAVGGGGGSGGGSSGSDPESPPPDSKPPDPEPGPGPPEFDTSEYRAQEGLALVNAADAYVRGLTGKGIVLAIFDSGLDVTHPEFQGQIAPGGYDFVLDTPDMTDPNGHGTHVSGIAAARKDDIGMHGVAYDAKLLPIRLFSAGGSLAVSDAELANAIDYAVARGAVVLNNSWGSPTPVTTVTRAQIVASIPQESAAWGPAVANDAVVVFSTGNDAGDQPAVRPGLPYHFPEYEGLWLAVVAVELDGDGTSYANACGVAADWCLAAPGGGLTEGDPGVFSTEPVAQGSYGRRTGTSMAAPHVSGAVAVLMELFPELSHEQVVARLLETANDSGIYADSAVYGHGLLDLEAATRPVGQTVILTGDSASGSFQTLEATRVDLGPAFGDGLRSSLRGTKLAVFDKYRAGFLVDLDSFVQFESSERDVSLLLDRFQAAPERIDFGSSSHMTIKFATIASEDLIRERGSEESRLEEFSFTGGLDNVEARASYNKNPGLGFGLQQAGHMDPALVQSPDAFMSPYLSFASEGYSLSAGTEVAGLGTLRFGSFTGHPDDGLNSMDATGSMAEFAVPIAGKAEISLQLGLLSEEDSLLGSRTEGAFDTSGTSTYFGGLTGKLDLTRSVYLAGSYFHGMSNPALARNSLFSDISMIESNAFSLGLIGRETFLEGDRLGFVVNQPLRVSKARAKLSLATGRTRDGRVLKEEMEADLAPRGRELDFEVFYTAPLEGQSAIGGSLALRRHPGHIEDEPPEAVALFRLTKRF